MDKMDRDRGNKTQRLYIRRSSYALSKLIVDKAQASMEKGEPRCLSSPATIDPLAHDPG